MAKRIFTILTILFFVLFDFSFNSPLRSSPTVADTEQEPISIEYLSNDILSSDNFASFEKTVNHFIQYWRVAGASVAIAQEGKLVYAKGFGYADVENGVEMQPYNLLRVASVSKLITAAAVMKLVENGELSLNQKVFGEEGILDNPMYRNYIDKRVEDITVKNLLNHSAGWTTRWGDHLFMSQSIARQLNKDLPIDKDDIIEFTLGKRLHFTPGTYSSYVNFGYLVLERVIEKVTKQNYEAFVRQNIFKPIGVFDAFIAHNYDSLRYPLETRYYEVPEAEMIPAYDGSLTPVLKSRGGNDIRTLGAAGGWVLSSVSLAKFLIAIDLYSKETVLSKKSIRQLTEKEPGFQPLGWRSVLQNGSKWRTGSFAGTSALAVSQNNGLTFVFISNTSPWVGARFPHEVNRMMAKALHRVGTWPEINLFNPLANTDNFVEQYFENQCREIDNEAFTFSWALSEPSITNPS
ncbi:MAG: serine hydrolase domain-containing protein [Bacteroidales bacterium]